MHSLEISVSPLLSASDPSQATIQKPDTFTMQRFVQILAVAAAAGSVAADNSVVTSLLLPYNDPNDFVATVLNVDQSATTFAYTCASSVSPDDCGMDTHGTIVQGPSTWQMTLSQSDDEDGLS